MPPVRIPVDWFLIWKANDAAGSPTVNCGLNELGDTLSAPTPVTLNGNGADAAPPGLITLRLQVPGTFKTAAKAKAAVATPCETVIV
jgi:uncharacterized protein YggE